MKALKKVAATLAVAPIAGIIALTGAGTASAAQCQAGYHWNDMGGGSGFCSPDASGGGTGGDATIDLGGSNAPAPQVPAVNKPPAYEPPVYAPLPPPAPVQVRPLPAPAPAQVNVRPAPAQNIPAQVAKERSAQVLNSVKGSEVGGIASAHGKEVSETNKAAAEVNKDEAAEKTTEVKEVDTTVTDPAVSTSPTPSPSEAPTQTDSIDASQASATEQSPVALIFTVLGGVAIAFAAGMSILRYVRRKNSRV